MWVVFAVIDIAQILALIIGLVGLGGVVFTALRFRRDDTTAVVTQQSTILNDMKGLNEELRITAASLKEERDACKQEVKGLRGELREARDHLSGQMTDIQEKLGDDDG